MTVPVQALIALLLFLGVAGGFYGGLRWDLAEVIEAKSDLASARANEKTLQAGMDKCNASVDGIKAAGDKLTAAAQSLTDQANKDRAKNTAQFAAIEAIHSTGEKCPVADSIISAGFR